MAKTPLDPREAHATQLDLRAWQAQYRDFDLAAQRGMALVQAAPTALWRGRGWAHVAFAQIRAAGPTLNLQALHQAEAAAQDTGCPLLQALCRDLQAVLLRREDRHGEALALLEPNLLLPEAERGAYAAYVSVNLASQCARSLGALDRTLHLRYRARAMAHALDDPALLANACANLGGLQIDLLNLEDGRALSAQAVAAAEAAAMQGSAVWMTASFNLAMAQQLGQDPVAALATVRCMQALRDRVPVAKRARYEVLWAVVALANGLADEARHGLDQARDRWSSDAEVLIEWHVAQAMLANHLGQYAQARAACDQGRALTQSGGDEVLPIDLMQLFDEGVRACEQLGDFQAALAYKHLAFAQYEQAAGRSARARHVTAEIQHALDLSRLAQEEATRRRLAAEAEQQRLAALNEALHQASETRSRFLAAASHDLRQPLYALGLQCANLALRLHGTPQAADLRPMQQSVAALTGIFDSLLDLSRIEAGAVAPRQQAVDVPTLLVQLVQEHAAEAERRGLRLALRVPPAARGLRVHTDPVLLDRLLRNLIGNALKYTPRGGVLLALRRGDGTERAAGSCGAPGPGRWRVQVFDTGIGLPAHELGRIFQAFYQVRTPGAEQAPGLGLGLSIVQRLSVLLGHPLGVRSRPGHGSCFGIGLDALPATAASHGALAGAPMDGLVAQPVGGPANGPGHLPADGLPPGVRVAVAEDDPEVRGALTGLLQGWGCQVVAEASAEALLQRLDAEPDWHPQALITDYRMPGALDGLGLAKRWHARWGTQAPVLMVSGDLQATWPAQVVVDRLTKPVRSEQLRAWLAQLPP